VTAHPPFGNQDLLARAASELRLGFPLRLTSATGLADALILAAGRLQDRWLEALRGACNGRLDLVITRRRAEVLKIRVYDDDLARIPLDSTLDAETVLRVSDPSRDLEVPLRGPFRSRRGGDIANARLALDSMRKAGLLAAAILGVPTPGHSCLRQMAALDRDIFRCAQAERPDLERRVSARMPLPGCETAHVHLFLDRQSGDEHLAIELGPLHGGRIPLVRVHSSCYTGDVLASLRCDCGPQLAEAIRIAGREGGIVVVLQQEGRGIGLANKIRAYALQDRGFDTFEANRRLGFDSDERDFAAAAAILRSLGFNRIRLMTNNPEKAAALMATGLEIQSRLPLRVGKNPHNAGYLEAKRRVRGDDL